MPRRLAITGPHKVEVIQYQDRAVGDNEVLVKTEIATGKHGTTLAGFDPVNFSGQRFEPEMRIFVEAPPAAPGGEPAPANTGNGGVGVVQQIGSAVTRWAVGDRVFGPMDVRETNICREDALRPLGDLDPKLALCADPAYVAFHCLRESQIRYGDKVAVIGLGAIGLMAVRMLAQAGAEQTFAVDMLANRRDWAARNGAHHVFDPTTGDVALEIHKLTGGAGVDVAIEVSGSYAALQTAIRATRITGTVCAAGFYQGEARALWLGRELHHNRLTVIVPHGCGWGHPPRDFPRWDERRAYDAIASLMRQGKLTAPGLIDPIVTIDEGPEVFRLIEQDPGKVIKFAVKF
ncbi:MAG: zinc-binding dehydrogenase [Armatimonadota bacterium]